MGPSGDLHFCAAVRIGARCDILWRVPRACHTHEDGLRSGFAIGAPSVLSGEPRVRRFTTKAYDRS